MSLQSKARVQLKESPHQSTNVQDEFCKQQSSAGIVTDKPLPPPRSKYRSDVNRASSEEMDLVTIVMLLRSSHSKSVRCPSSGGIGPKNELSLQAISTREVNLPSSLKIDPENKLSLRYRTSMLVIQPNSFGKEPKKGIRFEVQIFHIRQYTKFTRDPTGQGSAAEIIVCQVGHPKQISWKRAKIVETEVQQCHSC
jgi:hypothetical protein